MLPGNRNKFTQQPQNILPVISEFSAGVVFIPTMGIDIISQRLPGDYGTGLSSKVVTPAGIAASLSGSGTGKYSFKVKNSLTYSYIFYGILRSGSTYGLGRFFSTLNGSGGHDVYYDEGNSRIVINTWTTAGSNQGYVDLTVSKNPISLVITLNCSTGAGVLNVWIDGVKKTVTPGTASGTMLAGGSTLAFGNRGDSTDRQLNADMVLSAYTPNLLSSDLARSLSSNPWKIFRAPSLPLFSAAVGGGAAALTGAAQAVASASGAISVAVPMVGAAVSVATANGALSTALTLSGAAAAVAQASGTLTLGIALSGAALAKSVAAGALGTRFALGGTATAYAGASGTASSAFPLSGAAAGQAGATGHLTAASATALTGAAIAQAAAIGTVTVQFALSGAAVTKAAASGTLAVGGTSALAGTAQAVPAASGALSVAIPLSGAAQVVAGVTGNLTTGSPLAGAAVAVAAAAGNLMVSVRLSGTAVAQAMASGGLSLQVPLSAAALAHANASGTLYGGLSPIVSDARFAVRARQRNFTVTHAH